MFSDVQSVNIYRKVLQPSNTKETFSISTAEHKASKMWCIQSVSAVFLCSGKPCSRAVNIISRWYARQLLMWDLILPVFLRRLSFMSLHLFMVTSAWTHQSCAVSTLDRRAGNNTYTTCFYMKAYPLAGWDMYISGRNHTKKESFQLKLSFPHILKSFWGEKMC